VYKPECLAAQLFCEVMLPHESIIITGAERFSTYKGYGYSFRYAGNFVDTTPTVESLNALRNHIGSPPFGNNRIFRKLFVNFFLVPCL
jgi:hypothetical protein